MTALRAGVWKSSEQDRAIALGGRSHVMDCNRGHEGCAWVLVIIVGAVLFALAWSAFGVAP